MSSEELNIENKKVTIILYIFTYLSEEMFFFHKILLVENKNNVFHKHQDITPSCTHTFPFSSCGHHLSPSLFSDLAEAYKTSLALT